MIFEAMGSTLDSERNAAVRLYGRSGAVRVLAAVHRRVPWWEIRARIALADACARW